ncbi:hypothetical protein BDW62DRAFT_122642 [Aspergillus aurantiobrunneus]
MSCREKQHMILESRALATFFLSAQESFFHHHNIRAILNPSIIFNPRFHSGVCYQSHQIILEEDHDEPTHSMFCRAETQAFAMPGSSSTDVFAPRFLLFPRNCLTKRECPQTILQPTIFVAITTDHGRHPQTEDVALYNAALRWVLVWTGVGRP